MKTLFLSITSVFCILHAFAQNQPVLNVGGVQVNNSICLGDENALLYSNVSFTDIDGDDLFVLSTTATDTVIVDNSFTNIIVNNPGQLTIEIVGNAASVGSTAMDIMVTDGDDTITFSLPILTVHAIPTITFDPNPIICTNAGTVNLNQFVNPQGGSFNYDGIEYPNGDFNAVDAGITYNTSTPFQYVYTDGTCTAFEGFQVEIFFSPIPTIQTTNTICNGQTGTASVILSDINNTSSQAWSNGVMNMTSISNLGSGSYVYYHTDTNNCVTTQTFTIDPSNVSITPTVTNVSCYSQSTGAISITTAGLAAPVSYIWSTGQGNITTLTGLSAGTYTVYATDANNCQVVKHIQVTQPEKIDFDVNINTYPLCGGSDGEIIVDIVYGGHTAAGYTTQWSNAATGNTLSNIPAGIYSVNITDTAGCIATKPVYLSENGGADIDGSITPTACGSSNGKILVDIWGPDPVESISWSNGANTEDLIGVSSGNYVCTVILENTGCKSFKGWDVPVIAPLIQEICIITVDSATTTNLVVWEKAQPIGIDYYKIYRETSTQGEYVLIDTVNFQSLSMFNDVVASPLERSWSYKISAVNFCGVESPLSSKHKTINLNIINIGSTVQVSWNAYEGAEFTDYKVYRHTTAAGWELVGTVSNNTLSFNDGISSSTPGLDYLVEFELTNSCSAEKAQDFNTVRSNRERGQFSTGVGVDGASNNSIAVNYLNSIQAFPNPTTDKLTFVQTGNEEVVYTITSISGQVVSTISSNESTLSVDMSNLYSGIYLVELKMKDTKVVKRIVKI